MDELISKVFTTTIGTEKNSLKGEKKKITPGKNGKLPPLFRYSNEI